MLRFILSFFGGLFAFASAAVIFTGALIGAIFWMYSVDLPSYEALRQYSPKTISRIYSSEGKVMDEFAQERRIFVPVEEIPDLVKQAFISAEDRNFYLHRGFDPRGMASAAVQAVQTRFQRVRGASTIPQQVVKVFLLSSDRNAERKIKELILATRMESALSKDEILELYLNEIFLGQNSYGVAAAAQTYFNKTLGELSPAEAATLAAMPQAPSRSMVRDRDTIISRREYVLHQMWEEGYIDEATFEAENAKPLLTVQGGDYAPYRNSLPPRGYFTDEIRRQLSREFGEDEFFGGGLAIRATIVPDLQEIAAKELRTALENFDRGRGVWRGTRQKIEPELLADEAEWRGALANTPVARDVPGWYPAVVLGFQGDDAEIGIEGILSDARGHWIPARDVSWARKLQSDGRLAAKANRAQDLLEVGDVVLVRAMTDDKDGSFIRWTLRQVPEIQGGFMAMDVNTGRVMAMQGGFSYQASTFNRATQAMRQPGSSFKPFVYAAALDHGYTPATIVVDEEITVNTPQGLWQPRNASRRTYGPTPLRTGIEQSRNLMTIRIAQDIGMETVARYAEDLGVYDQLKPFLANSLGAQETTLFKMVAAYAMFANGGERVEPTLVDRVQDRRGQTIYRHDQRICETCDQPNLPAGRAPRIQSDRERVMDAITAYQLTSMMQGVILRGSGSGVRLPVPVAGKTGTTNDAKDVWFIGYTSNIVAGCYLGYDQPRSMGAGAFGGTLCVPVFQAFMSEAVKQYGGTEFKVPPGGHFVKIDRLTGAKLASNASGPNVIAEYFRDGSTPDWGTPMILVTGGFDTSFGTTILPEASRGEATTTVTTSSGEKRVIPKQADFGTMSSGGLY